MAKKILIMEDEIVLQELLAEKLKKHGYDVLAVDDGERGMEVIREYKPDLVLLDMMMPKLDGFSVLEEMRKENLIATFPVIVISNSGQPVEVDRALALGVSDYVIKVDFDPAEVVGKVQTFFAQQRPSLLETAATADAEVSSVTIAGDGGLAEEVAGRQGLKAENKNAGIRLLLVEDDDFLRGICELKLNKEGFDVTISADGLDALKKIQENDYQLVLLDVILPGMNGFDILETIKKDPEKSKVPIIMLTNMGQESEVKRGLDLGADDYIIKAHFTVAEIIEKIGDIITKKNIKGKEAV